MRTSLFIGIGIALSFSAQAADESCLVSFSSAQHDVCSGKVSLANPDLEALAKPESFRDSTLRLIKFDGPLDAARRAAVEAIGAEIVGYAPHYAYIVRMAPGQDAAARALSGVRWAGPFLPAFKVDTNVANEIRNGNIAARAGVQELSISLHDSADRGAVQAALSSVPGLTFSQAVTAGGDTRLLARFDRAQLRASVEALAINPAVSAIGFQWPMHLMNSQADWLHQSNVNTPTPLRPVFDKGLYGCGQIIGELDTGLHISNCAFNDATQTPPLSACTTGASCPTIAAPNMNHRKVISYYKWSGLSGSGPEDNHGHGTHVAGSILGQNPATPVDCTNFTTPGGNTDLDGTAPGAKLVMQESGSNLAYLNTAGGNPYHAASTAYANGARLHSNSWGGGCTDQFGLCISGCTVTYDALARDADNVTRDNQDLVVLFAAGNDATACPAGNNVGSPGNAKNVITVGATLRGTSANAMAGFSSRGPTDDARTKPDITAQGDSIISAGRNTCGTASMSGTSMATPTAAGLAALVREYLQRGFYPTGQKVQANEIANPSGALIKAILIAGAAGMTGNGAGALPGQNQGWGRVLLDNSLFFTGDSSRLYIHDAPTGLQTGGQDVHTLNVAAGTPLSIALTWTDVAAAVNANPALVNGLRLEVLAPDGQIYTQKLPAGVSVTNPNPTQDSTASNYDNRNNVHRIQFAAPAAGVYQVRVRGINVPTGPQKYALAATGNLTVNTGPDFALLATPGTANICAGSPATFSTGVLSLSGFTAPVALSVTGVPAGASGAFTVTPVTPADPAATSTLNVTNTGAVTSGSYNLVITGQSTTPAVTHTASTVLNVTAAAPVAGGLVAPANAATNVATTPAFSWLAIAESTSYRVQVATDAGFANLVVNQVVTGTTFTPATALNPNTVYHWRVIGINACGEGAASPSNSFTTANEICRSPALAIPDNTTAGVTDNLTVATTGTLTGLRLAVEVTHTYMGDLTLTLSKGATSVTFLQRPGNAANTGSLGCSGNDMNVIVDDAAVQTLESNCTSGSNPTAAYVTGAAYKPDTPLAAFAGQDLSGGWSLKAVDGASADIGNIVRWCLLPAVDAGPVDEIFVDGFEL